MISPRSLLPNHTVFIRSYRIYSGIAVPKPRFMQHELQPYDAQA
jgi:hypothetical protein